MFEKFTERARKVMSLARVEAQEMNSEFIGTEAILLGIFKEGGGIAVKALKAFKVEEGKCRDAIMRRITAQKEPVVTLGQLPFSPRAKRVLELAAEASCQLGHDTVGTEHLLIGLVKENESLAAEILGKAFKIRLEDLVNKTLEILGIEDKRLFKSLDPKITLADAASGTWEWRCEPCDEVLMKLEGGGVLTVMKNVTIQLFCPGCMKFREFENSKISKAFKGK